MSTDLTTRVQELIDSTINPAVAGHGGFVQLIDVKENKVLWENPAVLFRQEHEATSGRGVTDPVAFFQQDTNALERISSEFARTIVSAILEAF